MAPDLTDPRAPAADKPLGVPQERNAPLAFSIHSVEQSLDRLAMRDARDPDTREVPRSEESVIRR